MSAIVDEYSDFGRPLTSIFQLGALVLWSFKPNDPDLLHLMGIVMDSGGDPILMYS